MCVYCVCVWYTYRCMYGIRCVCVQAYLRYDLRIPPYIYTPNRYRGLYKRYYTDDRVYTTTRMCARSTRVFFNTYVFLADLRIYTYKCTCARVYIFCRIKSNIDVLVKKKKKKFVSFSYYCNYIVVKNRQCVWCETKKRFQGQECTVPRARAHTHTYILGARKIKCVL